MEDAYGSLPSSHLLGSVPAVIPPNEKPENKEGATASMQMFPPGNGGYRAPGSSNVGDEQPATSWAGVFSISSYTPYFNVDTDVVVDRLMSSVYPLRGDFFSKIGANPDLYAPVWISTTLVFMLAALGNCASYLMKKRIQYLGSNGSLIRLWCLWGYSLFIFIPASLLLVVPVEVFRWVIILLAGSASAGFISLNLRTYTEGHDLMVWVVSVFLLQFFLAILLKVLFFA